MIGLAVYLTIVVALAAVTCGHQGENFPIPLRETWQRLRTPHRASRASRDAGTPPGPAQRRTELHARPSWAHTEQDAA